MTTKPPRFLEDGTLNWLPNACEGRITQIVIPITVVLGVGDVPEGELRHKALIKVLSQLLKELTSFGVATGSVPYSVKFVEDKYFVFPWGIHWSLLPALHLHLQEHCYGALAGFYAKVEDEENLTKSIAIMKNTLATAQKQLEIEEKLFSESEKTVAVITTELVAKNEKLKEQEKIDFRDHDPLTIAEKVNRLSSRAIKLNRNIIRKTKDSLAKEEKQLSILQTGRSGFHIDHSLLLFRCPLTAPNGTLKVMTWDVLGEVVVDVNGVSRQRMGFDGPRTTYETYLDWLSFPRPSVYVDKILPFLLHWRYYKDLLKPSQPCIDCPFGFNTPTILNMSEYTKALDIKHFDSNKIVEVTEAEFSTWDDKSVVYLNRYLFQVQNTATYAGVLKFAENGRPRMVIKRDVTSMKRDMAPYKFRYRFVRDKNAKKKGGRGVGSEEPQTYHPYDRWEEHQDHTRFSRLFWVPWPGWECHLLSAQNDLCFPGFNTYSGYAYQISELAKAFMDCPVEDLRQFKRMVYNNLASCSDVDYIYIIRFLASCLQFPFRKLGIFLMLFGASGIGKGVLMSAIAKVLGHNDTGGMFYHNKSAKVDRQFNPEYVHRSFIFFDELRLDAASYDKMKTIITESYFTAEKKFCDAEEVLNFINCVGACNNLTIESMDGFKADDRRIYFADCVKTKSKPHLDLADDVYQRGVAHDGRLHKAFCFWLMNVDLSDFVPSRIPFSRSAMMAQLNSPENNVALFFQYCLQMETPLPSPGAFFLRDHNLVRTVCNPEHSHMKNPLGLPVEQLEMWKKWYSSGKNLCFIDTDTWEHMIKNCCTKEDENALNLWMIDGGWLSTVPISVFYNHFLSWCKAKGRDGKGTTEQSFLEGIYNCIRIQRIEIHRVRSFAVEFIFLDDLFTCQEVFDHNFPVLKTQSRAEFKKPDGIQEPPPIPMIAGVNSLDYMKRMVYASSKDTMMSKWAETVLSNTQLFPDQASVGKAWELDARTWDFQADQNRTIVSLKKDLAKTEKKLLLAERTALKLEERLARRTNAITAINGLESSVSLPDLRSSSTASLALGSVGSTVEGTCLDSEEELDLVEEFEKNVSVMKLSSSSSKKRLRTLPQAENVEESESESGEIQGMEEGGEGVGIIA